MEDFGTRLAALLGAREPQRVEMAEARDAAVLIPLIATPEPTLIFTVRTDTLPSHKGQIAFPGGSIDDTDASAEAAALREAEEEIGLDPDRVRILGELDTTPTFVSGYVIYPFVGWLEEQPDLDPNPAEVAEVLLVPLSELVEDIRREPGFAHGGRTFPTEAWVWRDHVIWGVTARIIRHFLVLLGEAGLAATPGPTDSWTAWPLTSTRS
ncbi:MAG TPA: CoA pyrophosphatase [Actinomycetota bacterium]|nr:CoA pyrophosphatase [Actinomycetota bacterium]